MSVIVVVEPHPLLRLGILQLLSAGFPESQIKETDYSSLSEAQPAENGCALVLLSIATLESIQHLVAAATRAYAPQSILLLSENGTLPCQTHHFPSIVAGYVPKNAAPEVLQASVRLVLAGGTCFPLFTNTEAAGTQPSAFPLTRTAETKTRLTESEPMAVAAKVSECEKLGLTPRQYEVLVLLARGYPMKTVGRLLNISVATAKAHTEMLYQRLDVHSRNAAVYEAVARGATLGWPNITTAKQHTTTLLPSS